MRTITILVEAALTLVLTAAMAAAQPHFGNRTNAPLVGGPQVLMFDLAGNGLDLSGRVKTLLVRGRSDVVAWTKPGTDDAFLVADAGKLAQLELLGAAQLSGGAPPTGWVLFRGTPTKAGMGEPRLGRDVGKPDAAHTWGPGANRGDHTRSNPPAPATGAATTPAAAAESGDAQGNQPPAATAVATPAAGGEETTSAQGPQKPIERIITAARLWEGLAKLDTNGDGALTPEDEHWGILRLFVDANGDGQIADDEVQSLAAAGIASLGLPPAGDSETRFRREDGGEGVLAAMSLTPQ